MAALAEHGLTGASRHLKLSKTQVLRRRNGYIEKQQMKMMQEQAA